MRVLRPLGYMTLGAAGTVALQRVNRSPQWRVAQMSGSSIATPGAAGWITDFLNAAYYQRARSDRNIDDLRLAFSILTTRWHRLGRRLTAGDVTAFHRAFGAARFLDATTSPRGTMNREQLYEGAANLFGDWFPHAYRDPARRGWGIVFDTVDARGRHRPEDRLAGARLGPLTPPVAPAQRQMWHTYPPVPVRSADAAAAALLAAETWPDYGSELGRFTPLRSGGLRDQTFEIEVVGFPTSRTPVFLRAYVTVTTLVSQADTGALRAYVDEVNDGFRRFGRDEPAPVPDGADPIAAFDLTCHEGHFMGNAKNRLFLYVSEGQAYLRAAGTWDEMAWHLDQMYSRAGRYAQHAFWGMESPDESMLHQIAAAVAGPAREGEPVGGDQREGERERAGGRVRRV
jgi:hypothetical protein